MNENNVKKEYKNIADNVKKHPSRAGNKQKNICLLKPKIIQIYEKKQVSLYR